MYGVLTSTFIHAQGIGGKTERAIWRSGLLTWEDFLLGHGDCRLSQRQIDILLPTVEESVGHFSKGNYSYFAKTVPSCEQWRAYGDFGDKAAYLDIETLGMGMDDVITVIGLYDGKKVKSFVKGFNLDNFPEAIAKYPLIVTYAGASFDLPHIRRAFPRIRLDQMHIDLCPTLRRLGLKGGLKNIEQAVGLRRPDGISGMSGWDAVRLWKEFEWGSRESLDLLIEYNAYDVVNLQPLAHQAYTALRSEVFGAD
jgi:uncharacterized protein